MSHFLRTPVAQKMIKLMMRSGKKATAEHILLRSLDHIRVSKKEIPLNSFYAALARVSPLVEVRTVRIRGRSFKVPIPVDEKRSLILGMRCLIKVCRRSKLPMHLALGEELYAASKGQGEAMKEKRAQAELALDSRPFSHYRWF